MTKRRHSDKKNYHSSNKKLLQRIVAIIVATISALFAYLGYITGIKSYMLQNYGIYWAGLLDGVLITLTVLGAVFFVAYKFSKE